MRSCASTIDLRFIFVEAVGSSTSNINLNMLKFIWATVIINQNEVRRLLFCGFGIDSSTVLFVSSVNSCC